MIERLPSWCILAPTAVMPEYNRYALSVDSATLGYAAFCLHVYAGVQPLLTIGISIQVFSYTRVPPVLSSDVMRNVHMFCLQVLLDVLRSLQQLHSLGLLHCDLKSGNVLLNSSPGSLMGFVAKLADFG